MDHKRLTLFAGHYGSGKTNIALNYALWLRRQGLKVTVADLDIVNPYFRTKDGAEQLKAAGVRLISSDYANSNVDLPALPGEAYSLVDDKSACGVIDVGGDDRGALALGRYVPGIREENDYEMLFVLNKARPLTKAEDVIAGERFAQEFAERVKLPVKMSCASEKLSAELQNKVSNFFPIQIMQLYYMEKEGTSLGKINL